MKIVCIGDSITFGYGIAKEYRWSEIVKNTLNINIINKGINGDTTVGMLSRSYKDVILNKPDKVIIMGGTNDFIRGHSYKTVEKNILELTKEALHNKIQPIIGIQIPTYSQLALKKWASSINYDKVNEKIQTYRQEIIEFTTKQNLKYIDFYKNFINECELHNINEYYVDGIHPNKEGHKIMAQSAIKVLGV
ncbi:GDSL-type esterase/lipase family protein [Haloimpatiens sp. FM7330]|uniref:GDSL-type esterase/lipase family protein n=1 Tax=Haloimpatiens sp. FM7330 TaxID=3298610 RepID=UPI00362846C4